MPTNFDREPAQIIAFPNSRLPSGAERPSQEATRPRLTNTEFGSCWYHEAAINEAELARKR